LPAFDERSYSNLISIENYVLCSKYLIRVNLFKKSAQVENESINYTEFGGGRANRQQTVDAVIEADFNYKSGA